MNISTEYFFIKQKLFQDKTPWLKPTEETSHLDYETTVIPTGSKPLIFTNHKKEDMLREKIDETIPDVLFDGFNILTESKIRKKLINLDVESLAIQPAIYIDNKDNWHENYWFLTFTKDFDCWDRKKSNYKKEPFGFPYLNPDDPKIYAVREFYLDSELLSKTPLRERLLFRMGSALDAMITAHESIASLFLSENVELIKIPT